MSGPYGLTPTGFVPQRAADILALIKADLQALVDPNIVVTAESPIGGITSALVPRLGDLWELGSAVYHSRDPQGATNQAADMLSAITGTFRRGPTAGLVSLVVALNGGTTLNAGSMASVNGQPANRWATTAAVTNSGATLSTTASGAQSLPAPTLNVASTSGWPTEGIVVVITATGPQAVNYTGVTGTSFTGCTGGSGSVANGATVAQGFNVPAQATQTGPIAANAGTISVIATPVSGWTAVVNPLDASEGRVAETDPQLLLRRIEELSNTGESTLPAMYAHLSEVTATIAGIASTPVVAAVTVQENASDYYDLLGRPPHTVEAIVQFTSGLSGADLTAARAAFALQLWQSKPGGIDTVGSQSLSVLDVQGNLHTVRWTEATLVDIWVSVLLQIDPTAYGGDTTVKDAIADPTVGFQSTMLLGQRVILSQLADAILEVPGVLDVALSKLLIGLSATALLPDNIAINARSLASFDTSRITITTQTADL